MVLATAVTATSLVIGTATAWITSRTRIRFAGLWMVVVSMPLVVPSYVAALTIIGATGNGGLFSRLIGSTVPTPYGFVGAWLALSVFLAPLAHLIVSPGLSAIDPATEEAAVGLGSTPLKTFWSVTLPQLRPSLVSAGLLVGLYTISDFGAVSLLRYDTFTRAIYTLYQGQIDRGPAQTLSAILMVVALVILITERRIRSRGRLHGRKPARRRQKVMLTRWQTRIAVGFLSAYAFLGLIVPAAVLGFWLMRGLSSGQTITSIWPEVGRSLTVSITAAAVATLAALPVAMVTVHRSSRATTVFESSVWIAYSLPHITVGIAMVGFALSWGRPLYQTTALLLFVYVSMFLAQSMSATQDSIRRVNPNLEEASRGLGRGQLSTLVRVTLPLVSSGMLAGAALVFIGVIKELPATLLLRPNGFETLAVRIWSATGEGFLTRASFSGLILISLSIIPLLLVTVRDLRN
jgi:iron(III) transport system permease protein